MITYYDYENEHGEIIYGITRKDLPDGGKKISQRRPDGAGGWISNLDGVTPVPYHLPAVLRTIERGGIVFIVEGERKCDALNDALAGLNAIATCNNGGAGKWGDQQSKWLQGARVCLLPDNDEPGSDHVEKTARSLMDIAASTKRINLPDLEPKGDIHNWLIAGHAVGELRTLYHAADEYTPPPEPERPKPVKPVTTRSGDESWHKNWAHSTLETMTRNLSTLPSGRFSGMRARANYLGTIAAHGLLTEVECVDHLLYACDSNGYTSKKGKNVQIVEREIRHYFNSGLPYPCDLPDPKEVGRPHLEIKLDRPQAWSSVPIAVRGQIIANVHKTAAPIIELIHEALCIGILEEDQRLCYRELLAASNKLGRGLSETTIRKGLARGASPSSAQFLRVFLPVDHIQENTEDSPSSTVNKIDGKTLKKVGRKTDYYQLLPIQEILDNLISYIMTPVIKEMFPIKSDLVAPVLADFLEDLDRPEAESVAEQIMGEYGKLIEDQKGYRETWKKVRKRYDRIVTLLKNPEFAPLPEGTYRNASEYVTLCARAIMIKRGGNTQIPLSDWAIMLGCTTRNVKAILTRAGIEVFNDQRSERNVTNIADIKNLKIGVFDKTMGGYPNSVSSSMARGYIDVVSRRLVSWCEGELSKGATLTIRYTQPNKQRLKPVEDALDKPKEVKEVPVAPKPKTTKMIDAPVKDPEPKKKRKTWEQDHREKLVELVAKSKKLPVLFDGKRVLNESTGEIQLTLDFLLNRDTNPEKINEIDNKDTADIVAWMVSDLGGTVSAVHDRGTPEYERCSTRAIPSRKIDDLYPNWLRNNLTQS